MLKGDFILKAEYRISRDAEFLAFDSLQSKGLPYPLKPTVTVGYSVILSNKIELLSFGLLICALILVGAHSRTSDFRS